jgi:hypothetical protein
MGIPYPLRSAPFQLIHLFFSFSVEARVGYFGGELVCYRVVRCFGSAVAGIKLSLELYSSLRQVRGLEWRIQWLFLLGNWLAEGV